MIRLSHLEGRVHQFSGNSREVHLDHLVADPGDAGGVAGGAFGVCRTYLRGLVYTQDWQLAHDLFAYYW